MRKEKGKEKGNEKRREEKNASVTLFDECSN
jgi:hypothetical protein